MKRLAILLIVALVPSLARAGVVRIYASVGLTLQLDLTKPPADPAYFVPRIPPGDQVEVCGAYPWSIYRALLKFDLSSIPDGSVVTAAIMHMAVYATVPTQEDYVELAERMSFDAWDGSGVDEAGYVGSTTTQLGSAIRPLADNNTITWHLNIPSWNLAADLADDAVTMQVRYLAEGDYYYKGTSYLSRLAGVPEEKWPYLELTLARVPGDIDDDGHVDVVDLLYLVDAFGSVFGDGNYNPAADFNSDGSVDVVDLLILVENFGT